MWLGTYLGLAVMLTALAGSLSTVVGVSLLRLVDEAILDGSGASPPSEPLAAAGATDDRLPPGQVSTAASTASVVPVTAPSAPIVPPKLVPGDDVAARYHNGTPGTYRTYCVRLCDGYFWPVSFSTTADRFAQDEAQCASACGSPARLFVHPTPGGSPSTMTSLKGVPYAALKTAFLFRTRYDAQCKCQSHPWEQLARDRHRLLAASDAARKGDRAAASEARQLAAKISTEVAGEQASKASAVRAADRELASIARAVGARPIGGETAPARSPRLAAADGPRGPRPPNMMRLGVFESTEAAAPTKRGWRPASGTQRRWQDRAFGD